MLRGKGSIIFGIGVAILIQGCGERQSQLPSNKALADRLASGEVIRAINETQKKEDNAAPAVSTSTSWVENSALENGVNPEKIPTFKWSPGCETIQDLIADTDAAAITKTAKDFGNCFREALGPANLINEAFDYVREFNLNPSLKKPSQMTLLELYQFFDAEIPQSYGNYLANPGLRGLIRTTFAEADLDELTLLAQLRTAYLIAGVQAFYKLMDRVPQFLNRVQKIDRYAALLALKENADNPEVATFALALTLMKTMEIPVDDPRFPKHMVPIYSLMALSPGIGQELRFLNPNTENPFTTVLYFHALFGAGNEAIKVARSRYKWTQTLESKPLPEHPPLGNNPVRVALIDSGIDYYQFADLGRFLGRGKNQEMSSRDYADSDENPWAPSFNGLAHGTGTAATVLTIAARYGREMIENQGLDLAMWKVFSNRGVLSTSDVFYSGSNLWETRHLSFWDAIVDQTESPGVKPDIVSVSLTFMGYPVLGEIHKEDILTRSDWLWVVAAGNSGMNIKVRPDACFGEFPANLRPDDRILCVGALKRGIIDGSVASYSNYGDRVDVYAYESYQELCPNGTSCATPAVSGAAAILKRQFPALTSADLKSIIVKAARLTKLGNREVKVFDPETMMSDAIQIAADHVLASRAPTAVAVNR